MGKKIFLIVALVALLVGCIPVTPELTSEPTTSITSTSEGYPAPYPVSTPLFPAKSPTAEAYPQPVTSDATATSVYPQPLSTQAPAYPYYPPPEFTPESPGNTPAYPGPETTYPQPTQIYPYPQPGENSAGTSSPNPTVGPTITPTNQVLETPTSAAPGAEAATPTAFLPEFQPSPVPGEFTTIRIWHSWSGQQVQVLEQAIQVFQSIEPNVSFDLQYVPYDSLAAKYEAVAYTGEGPSLVFGDSDWVAQMSRGNLVKDLTPYLSDEFVETLSPPALGAVQINSRTFALPYGMRGIVLYRNKLLVPTAPASFDQLLEYAGSATRSGNVGLYLDWGCYFSCGLMQGLGGHWLDDQGQVQFDADNYQAAASWLSQLQQIKNSGALIEFNQDEAINLFTLGKIGMTIDGSWRAWKLADAIGYQNLEVDPWPSNGSGRMAAYVQADAVFLNSNVANRSLAEEQAALRFMGLLLTPEVQLRLAEVGFIPTVKSTQPRDAVKVKLMAALNSGVAFPPAWQGELRQAYWASIDAAAQAVLERGVPPREALETAANEIKERLSQIKNP